MAWYRPAEALDWQGRALFTEGDLNSVDAWYREIGLPESPLRRLPPLAEATGIADLIVKDETERLGLSSFKILGANFAVGQLVGRLGRGITDVACATAGNHGRAVVAAGIAHNLRVHVFVPTGTAAETIAQLSAAGGDVVVTDADYDATVELMAAESKRYGWTVVADTALDVVDDTARNIMLGYTRIFEEARSQWARQPDVIIVQAGVGSLAGAAAAWLQARFPAVADRPRLVVAEPDGSACVLESLIAGRPTALESCAPTIMVGLRCGRINPLAWTPLAATVEGAMTVSDELCRRAMALLASPGHGLSGIVTGPSGACGFAALLALRQEPDLQTFREELGINARTTALVIATEAGRTEDWQYQPRSGSRRR